MRKRQEEGAAEDATLLAGWMYADLLLGLMVIFLATISFVPIDNFVSKSLVKATYKQVDKAFNFNRGLSLVYEKFDAKGLEQDIEAFKKREGLDNDAEIIYDESKPTTIPYRLADTSLAKEKLGFLPFIDLKKGLEDTIKWFIENYEIARK